MRIDKADAHAEQVVALNKTEKLIVGRSDGARQRI